MICTVSRPISASHDLCAATLKITTTSQVISEITLEWTVFSLLLKAQPEKTAIKAIEMITATEHSSVMYTS